MHSQYSPPVVQTNCKPLTKNKNLDIITNQLKSNAFSILTALKHEERERELNRRQGLGADLHRIEPHYETISILHNFSMLLFSEV